MLKPVLKSKFTTIVKIVTENYISIKPITQETYIAYRDFELCHNLANEIYNTAIKRFSSPVRDDWLNTLDDEIYADAVTTIEELKKIENYETSSLNQLENDGILLAILYLDKEYLNKLFSKQNNSQNIKQLQIKFDDEW